jgi:spermidine/putrescine transport system substrate-binding protein
MTRPLTRRQLLERAAFGGAALSLPSLLAACGGGGIEGSDSTTSGAANDRTLANTLVISNWPLYIDIDEKTKKRPTIQQFMQKTGVNVRYIEDVNDNEEWFGKYQAQLKAGDDIGRDIAILTDWMAARMIRLGYAEKLDKSAIRNAKNLQDALLHPAWDQNRDYTMPWQSGLTGIAYNPKLVGGKVTTIEQLLTDEKLKGRVTALTEMPDTMGLIIASNGDDPEKVTDASFDKAIGTLEDAVDSGQIRRFTGNDYLDDLAAGNLAVCQCYSGDVAQLVLDNPNLNFVVPEEGMLLFSDNMVMPLSTANSTGAEAWMDYCYDPVNMARITAEVQYIPAVEGTGEELAAIDPALADNPLINPPAEYRDVAVVWRALSDEEDQQFTAMYAEVTQG